MHVLLVDDNPDDRELVLRHLLKEFPDILAEQVSRAQELETALDRGGFALVITDYRLRWTNGIAVLTSIKERYPDCPVIMFTGTGNEEVAVEAMKAGLDDYIVKKATHFVRIRSAVRAALERARNARKSADLERRFDSLLRSLNLGVFRCSVHGQLLDANVAFLRLAGIESETELPEANLQDFFIRPSDCTLLMDQLLRSGMPQEIDAQLCTDAEVPIWCRMSQTLNTDLDGNTVIDGLLENVTDRKVAEEELRQRAEIATRLAVLSPREHQVMKMVANGKTNRDIATELHLSIKTVEMHRANLMRKLAINNMAELIRIAVLAGMLPHSP